MYTRNLKTAAQKMRQIMQTIVLLIVRYKNHNQKKTNKVK